ncbi:MAG: flavin reductase [Clostridia bacterium]|nr:flavin reductase [Clostridia bacterium]MDD4375446.1 flavin reductase [Clostridia bacterium]
MKKNVLMNITYGMYLVGSKYKNNYSGMISTTVCQSTSEPETITVIINKDNYTHDLIEKSKKISISILSTETTFELIGKFGFNSGRDTDKLIGVNYIMGDNDVPVITTSMTAYIEAKVINSFDIGTHTIFFAKVTKTDNLDDKVPMTYEYYHTVIKGTSPKNAPTYSLNATIESNDDNKYKCSTCGYVYDESSKGNIKFDKLHENWVCPVCGMHKIGFNKI